ncbi:MAG: DUF3823 domain-containing protein [Parabacteroides sp.]
MKLISNIFSLALLLVLFASCGKDNYDAPQSTLNGTVVYQGQALQLRGTGEAVRLQLYQDGYEKHDPINVYVGQDGKFAAKLFDGQYKLVTRDGNGPWENKRDTMVVNLNGSTEVQVEVTPYFLITNTQLSVSGTTMNASFTINQIVPSASINKVFLLLSKTQFADDVNNLFRQDVTDVTPGVVNLTADLAGNNDVAKATTLFARVGVLANGADQAIYSEVVRIR